MVIRKVGIGSVVKVFGVLYGLLGFVIGACVAMFALVGFGAASATNDEVPAWFGSLFGIGAVIILPIVYGIMGAIGGVLMAALYNLVAGITGGLEIEVQ
jgi:hypothetical protein